MLDRKQLKAEAKAITKKASVSAYLFTLVYLVIDIVLSLISDLANGGFTTNVTNVNYMMSVDPFAAGMPPEAFGYASASPAASTLGFFVAILIGLLSIVLSAGYILYIMGVRKGRTMPYTTLFDAFSFVGKVIWLQILTFIYVFLWSLLLFIPGIIAGYRYRFALYNLCENPEISASEALRMSKAQTRGYKWQLFVLDLSFLGWSLLCALTLGILTIWILPYIQQTDIGYFEEIKKASGVGYLPTGDGQFHHDDRFDTPSDGGDEQRTYDPER